MAYRGSSVPCDIPGWGPLGGLVAERAFREIPAVAAIDAAPNTESQKIIPVTVQNVIESNEEAVRTRLAASGGIYEGQGNPALVGFDADPDGDGVPNAIELLLGTDPSNANAQPPIRPVTVQESGQSWLAYEYGVAANSGVSFRCMGSSDMKTWKPIGSDPVLVSSSSSGFQIWRIRDDEPLSNSTQRFMRLEVSP